MTKAHDRHTGLPEGDAHPALCEHRRLVAAEQQGAERSERVASIATYHRPGGPPRFYSAGLDPRIVLCRPTRRLIVNVHDFK